MDGWSDLANLLAPRYLMVLGGLLLCLAIVWATAFVLRDPLAALLLRGPTGPRPGEVLTVGRFSGVVVAVGWQHVTLQTVGGSVRVPNQYLLRHPFEVATGSSPSVGAGAGSQPAPEMPPIDADSSLADLRQAHAATLAAIAALSGSPLTGGAKGPADPASLKQRQQQLVRQLARYEALIDERRRAGG